MARWDYQKSRELTQLDPSFEALIMAAARKADSGNFELLRRAFPGIVAELQARYDAPNGILPGE